MMLTMLPAVTPALSKRLDGNSSSCALSMSHSRAMPAKFSRAPQLEGVPASMRLTYSVVATMAADAGLLPTAQS